jgi:SEC-C motif-containing protein
MRSRFAAYAMGKAPYILETSGEPRQDEALWLSEVVRFAENTQFTGLTIVNVEPGEKVAYVTFRAELQQLGQDVSFTERSRFERTDRWRYVSGERL